MTVEIFLLAATDPRIPPRVAMAIILGISVLTLGIATALFYMFPNWRYFIGCGAMIAGLIMLTPPILLINKYIKIDNSKEYEPLLAGLLIAGMIFVCIGAFIAGMIKKNK